MIDTVNPTPLPPLARKFTGLLSPLYRFFDWLYGSRYNPLYRSGTLAVGFLLVLLITGIYLSFFYSVSTPYASVVSLDHQLLLGRWIRALHRYSTVACLIAVLFHVAQLLAQGKTWGPRFLAWVSGVILTGVLLISAWSGYVMVWDAHGQLVALSGAKLLSLFPILGDLFQRSFSGASELPPGFFFMNLFLHVALPLLMVLGLWVHTSRLSRAVWFPERRIFWVSLAVLLLASVIQPAPLLREANVLQLVGRIPIDLATGFWIPFLEPLGAWAVRLVFLAATAAILLIPWWWRPPRRAERPVSEVDLERCTGCTQCVRDCPYEAITMIPRKDGKRLIAEVNPNHCVSCGICAASCADFAIGPPGRSASDQHERVLRVCSEDLSVSKRRELTIIACANNYELSEHLRQSCADSSGTTFYPVECCGCVHSDVLERILDHSSGVALIGCPARNCLNRDGGDLLGQRIFEKRVPFLDRAIDRKRVYVGAFSGSEKPELESALCNFRRQLNPDSECKSPAVNRWSRTARMAISTAIIAAGTVAAAQWPIGADSELAMLRVSGLMPSFAAERCRPPGDNELQDIPQHMRPKEICTRVPLLYKLQITVDNHPLAEQVFGGPLSRVDSPLYISAETGLTSGVHQLDIQLASIEPNTETTPLTLQTSVEVEPGEIVLVLYDRESRTLRAIRR